MATETAAQTQTEPQPLADLPKLSPSEFRAYNRLAEHMDSFVSLFHVHK